ncbi:MAG: abortive infection family protein [Candidatus Shapirobacteria bacterium]|jgi:hypothetical protein
MDVSPNYLMKLVGQIDAKIWQVFETYKNVNFYIKKWQTYDSFGNANFNISYIDNKIDLKDTLHSIDNENLIKIAVDLGIETPDFIPSVPVIKNVLKNNFPTAFDTFKKAIDQIEENPDLAIGSANSTLESIIKHISDNSNISKKVNKKDTLYKLTQDILKEFSLFPTKSIPVEIKTIGSSLLNLSQNIESLRSNKTTFHGKSANDYIVDDPLYAYFIVNIVSSIGLFLISFYEKKYNKLDLKSSGEYVNETTIDEMPF